MNADGCEEVAANSSDPVNRPLTLPVRPVSMEGGETEASPCEHIDQVVLLLWLGTILVFLCLLPSNAASAAPLGCRSP